MAGEITIMTSFSVRKDQLQFTFAPGVFQADMVGQGGPTPGYVTIGTTEESIAFGELTTQGYLIMQNLDPDNYVRWGFSTGVYGGRVNAGEVTGPFRLNPGSTLYLIADTDPCKMLVLAFEN
jgi:hypothetical protein